MGYKEKYRVLEEIFTGKFVPQFSRTENETWQKMTVFGILKFTTITAGQREVVRKDVNKHSRKLDPFFEISNELNHKTNQEKFLEDVVSDKNYFNKYDEKNSQSQFFCILSLFNLFMDGDAVHSTPERKIIHSLEMFLGGQTFNRTLNLNYMFCEIYNLSTLLQWVICQKISTLQNIPPDTAQKELFILDGLKRFITKFIAYATYIALKSYYYVTKKSMPEKSEMLSISQIYELLEKRLFSRKFLDDFSSDFLVSLQKSLFIKSIKHRTSYQHEVGFLYGKAHGLLGFCLLGKDFFDFWTQNAEPLSNWKVYSNYVYVMHAAHYFDKSGFEGLISQLNGFKMNFFETSYLKSGKFYVAQASVVAGAAISAPYLGLWSSVGLSLAGLTAVRQSFGSDYGYIHTQKAMRIIVQQYATEIYSKDVKIDEFLSQYDCSTPEKKDLIFQRAIEVLYRPYPDLDIFFTIETAPTNVQEQMPAKVTQLPVTLNNPSAHSSSSTSSKSITSQYDEPHENTSKQPKRRDLPISQDNKEEGQFVSGVQRRKVCFQPNPENTPDQHLVEGNAGQWFAFQKLSARDTRSLPPELVAHNFIEDEAAGAFNNMLASHGQFGGFKWYTFSNGFGGFELKPYHGCRWRALYERAQTINVPWIEDGKPCKKNVPVYRFCRFEDPHKS